MGTWLKGIPPKMMHDTAGVYQGKWMSEMDRCWIRKEDGVVVCSRLIDTNGVFGKVEHVSITRDITKNGASFHGENGFTWAEKQEIKDELFGKDRTAIEVYPAEDRMVDEADVYHLWVLDKKFKLPFGIHPKEDKRAINRGYRVTQEEIRALHEYYAERK